MALEINRLSPKAFVSKISRLKGFLSLDVDVSHLEVNQCEARPDFPSPKSMFVFHGSHKCHNFTSEGI
ncbi:hypothetical protein HUJ04_007296 [Dendroctonus ponderosae]|nr:hypothetical protein HUJ04_007296 [Dendroctonus ponderosae]